MSKLVFFILLGVALLLYFGALGIGLAKDDGSGKPDDTKKPWVSAIDSVMGAFAPRVALRNKTCDNQAVANTFTLKTTGTAVKKCTINLKPKPGDDHARTEVAQVGGGGVKVYLLSVFDEEYFPKNKKDPACKIQAGANPKPGGKRLLVTYEPAGGVDGYQCWLDKTRDESLSFTALEEGGDLTLEFACTNCSNSATSNVRLRLK